MYELPSSVGIERVVVDRTVVDEDSDPIVIYRPKEKETEKPRLASG